MYPNYDNIRRRKAESLEGCCTNGGIKEGANKVEMLQPRDIPECNLVEAEKGAVTRFRPKAGEEGTDISEDIKALVSLMREKVYQQDEQIRLLTEISLGISNKTPSGTYFDTGIITIDVASPNVLDVEQVFDPTNPLVPGYTQIRIHDTMQRNSSRLHVINDGPDTLFVRTSNNGRVFSEVEIALLFGEARTFSDVYELRVRSTNVANQFRATEHDFWIAYSAPISISTIVTNRLDFEARRIAAPVGGAVLPNIVIPNEFSVVVRSNVDNAAAGRVYVANSIVDTGVAADRVTLSPGDATALTVNNANRIAIRGNQAGLFVDILVEI